MALVLKDRVQEAATPNTTVSFTCAGAIAGFQAFSVIGNGNTTFYTGVDGSGNWESGIGTYTTAGNLVTRTTILSSSNGGSAVTFSGSVSLFVDYPATKSINYDANGVATIGETLGYSDTGLVSSFASTVAGYNQVVVQNKSTATNASSNLNVSNDAGTASQNYAELGINSSTFSNGAGCFNIPGAAYVASAGEDLSIGTYNSHNIHFATNSNTTDSMTIYTSGGISLGTYGDPGLGNVAGNKFVAGYSSITSAAGTTILTAASTYYQRVVGTAIQTIQLPDATTCLVGTTFIIENDSTGLLTIRDNASGAVDVIPAGGVDYIYLIANGTVAGTWARYALLPSTYNFNATAADFGAATLSNGVWNGTPIAYNYGGTTLTTFVGANNALYSTSASALTAGTLPVLAGGTGVTTSTGSGNNVLSTSPTLVTPALGTPSSGTLTNCTFPTLNQNTTGYAAALSGGSAGTVPYQSSVNTTAMLAAGTSGQVLKSNGAAPPTWTTPTTGTVTSVATSGNVSGITLTGGTITGSGTITLGGAIGTLNQNTTGSSGSCTGNAATATTATTCNGNYNTTNAQQNGTDGWWRSTGQAGWYSSTYAVGIWATEAGNVRTYNGANFIAAGTISGSNLSGTNTGDQTSVSGSSGSCTGNAATATGLTSGNYISAAGSSGNLNTDFQNTTAYTKRYQGDCAGGTNNPGNTWWFYEDMRHSNSSNYWGTQVAWGWEDNANRLATRNVTGGSFGSWVYYLNSANYTSYAPSLTGSGASGTWGINVTGSSGSCTGNAATASNAIGVGQTWQNVSRVKNTTYTNSTGRSIEVYIQGFSTVAISLTSNGVQVGSVNSSNFNIPNSFIVPSGGTYIWASASGTISIWAELR